jgi:hypothetical protein
MSYLLFQCSLNIFIFHHHLPVIKILFEKNLSIYYSLNFPVPTPIKFEFFLSVVTIKKLDVGGFAMLQ